MTAPCELSLRGGFASEGPPGKSIFVRWSGHQHSRLRPPKPSQALKRWRKGEGQEALRASH